MFFENDLEFTKHGYYQVDTVKTFSKFEAYNFAKGDMSKIQFIYNDDVMSQVDWTQEPTESIDELYLERVNQLRSKYDYLVLMYSGGIDSHTILETFLKNNVHLNEICTFTTEKVEHRSSKFNQEVFKAAVPYVKSLDLTKLGTKFRLVDITDMIINMYNDEFHFEHHHLYNQGAGPQWVNATRSHITKSKIEDHMKLTENGKSVCYIWGFDKPRVAIEDNKYYCKFVDNCIDLNMRQYVNRSTLKDKFGNFYDEAFYISREFPKITIKQVHALFKAIKSISYKDPILVSQDELPTVGPFVTHHRGQYYRFLPKLLVDQIIYPSANINRFGDDKLKGSVLLSAKDNWFHYSNHHNQHKWFQNLDNLIKQNQNLYKFKNNKPMSINSIPSRGYLIGEFNVFKDDNKK